MQENITDRSTMEHLARRWATEAVAAGRLEVFDEIAAADILDRSIPPAGSVGVASLKARAALVSRAFGGIAVSIDELLIDGDRLAWRWTLRGTHTGPFFDIAPTGKRIELPGINLQRARAGKIVEHWTMADLAGIVRQLRS